MMSMKKQWKRADRNRILPLKSHQVNTRLTEKQYEILVQKAALAQMSVSDYIRELILNEKVPITVRVVREDSSLERIYEMLSHASNNLNQIARYFHMGGIRSERMQEEIMDCIHEIMEARKLLDGGSF